MVIVTGKITKKIDDKVFVRSTNGDDYLVRESNLLTRNDDNIVEFDDKNADSNWRFPLDYPDDPDGN